MWHARKLPKSRFVFRTEIERRQFYELVGGRLLYEVTVCVDGQVRRGWVFAAPNRMWMLAFIRVIAVRIVRRRKP